MSLISSASAEQSSGLSEISSAVGQLDSITQRNAQMVERAVSQANQLEGRAANLAQAVASFVLQQGTAEEAMELVQRALNCRSQSNAGCLCAGPDRSRQGFFDRDMYVFALDRPGHLPGFWWPPRQGGQPRAGYSGGGWRGPVAVHHRAGPDRTGLGRVRHPEPGERCLAGARCPTSPRWTICMSVAVCTRPRWRA